MTLYLLYESSSGYALFERVKGEEVEVGDSAVQDSILDLARFSKMVKLKGFLPFQNAENALENINAVSEGELTPFLRDWLESTVPKEKKTKVGVLDPKIGNAISEALGLKAEYNETVLELLRGIRLHFGRFIKALKPGDIAQSQLGLGHSYSRSKVKFNVNRVDNMIIQAICLLDQLDKDLNTFAMRVREWYSWHFPELVRIVNDNTQFCLLAVLIRDKSTLNEDKIPQLAEIVGDEAKAREIVEAARMSMGTDISPIDLINIEQFATRVSHLQKYRKDLHEYLIKKMNSCAPNLSALIGEMVGARLISHAGSLTSLAKYPASTVQILGAEKALFRSLKTKGNTPKYGLIFHSSFIGRANPKNKGRIARYLANKCSIASRIDSFTDTANSDVIGQKLKQQVEERLEFYKTGTKPRKNIDVMKEAMAEAATTESKEGGKKQSKKDKKRKSTASASSSSSSSSSSEAPANDADEKPKKVKKSKKEKQESAPAGEAALVAEPEKKKKSKKDKKEKAAEADS
jgi:nucleolar protein 56